MKEEIFGIKLTENVRYPSTRCTINYIKNTLTKCYNREPNPTEVKAAKTMKNGYRRFYLCKDKTLYRGWWKENLKDGWGTHKRKVDIYEGEFRKDKPTGYGVLSREKANGSRELQYEGDFDNGAPNGKGELHTDTYHYIGQVINGKASGFGIAWYNNGSMYYGSWFNGKRMGQGMQVSENRNRYEGNWYNDEKHGSGQYCFFDRGQALEGIWVAGVCIRGIIRNIKYRQAATDPVKYAIPVLMLKDWATAYYCWEKEAFARVGKYVREDIGIKVDRKKNDSGKRTFKKESYDITEEDLARQTELLELNQYAIYPADFTLFQPCVLLRNK